MVTKPNDAMELTSSDTDQVQDCVVGVMFVYVHSSHPIKLVF
jgi:hypothetical protein